jgi:8-oxo-dGTP pyrophosphatase MutT (NUDIX family)
MHRRLLLSLIDSYLERFPEDRERAEAIRRFVAARAACFERSCLEGHVTGSAWVVSPDGARVLLVRHRKLAAWLQPGGHADGDPDPAAVALREAVEESGLASLRHFDWWSRAWTLAGVAGGAGGVHAQAAPQPFDLDVHQIPVNGAVPAHLHYDVRYLLLADPAESPRSSPESDDVRWVARSELVAFSREPSLLRMAGKAARLALRRAL